MFSSTIFPIQNLPVELIRSIFELAAYSNDGLLLALVSRQVREWVMPVVYEMVTLGSDDGALFIRTMDSLPRSFFAQHVKKLCLTVSIRPHDAVRIMESCTGVTSLACWVDFRDTHLNGTNISLDRLFAPLQLRRLSIEQGAFQRLPMNTGWHLQLSHLDLRMWTGRETFTITNLFFLFSLTHLAIYTGHWELEGLVLEEILTLKPNLQVLCVVEEEHEEYRAQPMVTDPRLVYLPRPEPVPDWEAPFWGIPDTWHKAEELVARRMNALQSSSIVSRASMQG